MQSVSVPEFSYDASPTPAYIPATDLFPNFHFTLNHDNDNNNGQTHDRSRITHQHRIVINNYSITSRADLPAGRETLRPARRVPGAA